MRLRLIACIVPDADVEHKFTHASVVPGQPGPAFGRPGRKLVPGIHASPICIGDKAWIAGTSPAMTAWKRCAHGIEPVHVMCGRALAMRRMHSAAYRIIRLRGCATRAARSALALRLAGFALAQIILGGARHRPLRRAEGIETLLRHRLTRQSAHILMASSRLLPAGTSSAGPRASPRSARSCS